MHALVDAFIKGRAALKKDTGLFFDDEKKPKKACYVGAVYYGLYGKPSDTVMTQLSMDWPQIRKWVAAPCGHDDEGGYISAILIHLNDEHSTKEWNDKRITEWFESVI